MCKFIVYRMACLIVDHVFHNIRVVAVTGSRFNILSAGPGGSVCVSCCLVSDVKWMWLPTSISQMFVAKVISKLRIALEFKENEWNNNVVGSYMHAIASLAFFIRPGKMKSFANIR